MPKTSKHVYGRYTREAVTLLGKLVALGRKRHRMTAQNLAERVGISRGTLLRLERGDPKVEIGVAFEAATIVGVTLFDADMKGLTGLSERADDRLALLPKYVREPAHQVDDDF
jgi:transcriptional regulator with XRE-family HTH domain